MAIKRIVSTDFWTDDKVVDMFSAEDKYFMLYLLTNPHTTQLGIYKLNCKLAAFELGLSVETVKVLIDRFENKYHLIRYSVTTQEVAIKNYLRHSVMTGGTPVYDLLCKEMAQVKNKDLLHYVFDWLKKQDKLNLTVLKVITNYFNDNDNENENEKSVHDSAYDSVHDMSKPLENKTASSSACPYQEIVDNFNSICVSLPKVKTINGKRKQAIKARWNEYKQSTDIFIEAFNKVEESDFLKGKNKMNWIASFDWLMTSGNLAKVLEGNYDVKAVKQSKYLF